MNRGPARRKSDNQGTSEAKSSKIRIELDGVGSSAEDSRPRPDDGIIKNLKTNWAGEEGGPLYRQPEERGYQTTSQQFRREIRRT